MRNKIPSRHGKHSGKRSSSSSSIEIIEDTKYKKRKKCSGKHKHRKHSEKKDFDRKRKSSQSSSRSRSSSNGSSESDKEEDNRGSSDSKKHTSMRYKSTKSENIGENVKIKEEPITDDEHHRNSRKYHSDGSNRRRFESDVRGRKRSRSRSRSWNNDRHPIKQERFSDGNHERRPIKKERFSDIEKEPRWGKQSDVQASGQDKKKPMVDKSKPDFGLSGKLAEETNTYNGVVIKYSEPPEARKPKRRWRLYPFKGDESLKTLYIHRQSAFLIGRDRKVADLPVDHPSCSKQHAVLQYRLVPFERSDGTRGKRICPYIIDLESANGTFVNNVKIEPKKYVELFEKDVLKFAFSSREYVLLHEHSKDSGDDDDICN